MTTFYAVFEWTDADNGWYDLAAAVGSRVFKTERGAKAFAAKVTASSLVVVPRGYVVRDAPYIKVNTCVITPAGRIEMPVPCSCPLPGSHVDARCAYHFPAAA